VLAMCRTRGISPIVGRIGRKAWRHFCQNVPSCTQARYLGRKAARALCDPAGQRALPMSKPVPEQSKWNVKDCSLCPCSKLPACRSTPTSPTFSGCTSTMGKFLPPSACYCWSSCCSSCEEACHARSMPAWTSSDLTAGAACAAQEGLLLRGQRLPQRRLWLCHCRGLWCVPCPSCACAHAHMCSHVLTCRPACMLVSVLATAIRRRGEPSLAACA
jgi:hypothetical protein